MHKFDPETEPATVQIEVNPRRYATIAKTDAHGKVLRKADGKDDVVMLHVIGTTPGEESRMWVPPRIADDLTAANAVDASRGIPAVARIIKSRTAEEAGARPVRKKE